MLKVITVLAVAAVTGCSSGSDGYGGAPATDTRAGQFINGIVQIIKVEDEPTIQQYQKDACYVGGSLVGLGFEDYRGIYNDLLVYRDGTTVERLEVLFNRKSGRMDMHYDNMLELIFEGYVVTVWEDHSLVYDDAFNSYYVPCILGERKPQIIPTVE